MLIYNILQFFDVKIYPLLFGFFSDCFGCLHFFSNQCFRQYEHLTRGINGGSLSLCQRVIQALLKLLQSGSKIRLRTEEHGAFIEVRNNVLNGADDIAQ